MKAKTQADSISIDSYTLRKDVVWLTAEDGSSRLFDMNDVSYGLNELATRMLAALTAGSRQQAIEAITSEFQIERAVADADMQLLIDKLAGLQLIVRADARSESSTPPSNRLMRGVMFPALKAVGKISNLRVEAFLTMSLIRLFLAMRGLPECAAALEQAARRLGSKDQPVRDRTVEEVEAAVAATVMNHPSKMACKERALCCWFMLKRRRAAAEVVVGVTLSPVTGHCWCESGNRIIADTVERCSNFTPIWRY